MRIATWNVHSLKARLEKVTWWLERARPDVLLMQETKLADAAAPVPEFRAAGYAAQGEPVAFRPLPVAFRP
jgi:exodeoxyribonuclease III